MKRLFISILSVLMMAAVVAAPRDAQEALRQADAYFSARSSALRMPARTDRLSLAWTAAQADGNPAFYVFNRGEEDGFVLISAEDRTPVVIGYADHGHFDAEHIPSNARAWYNRYAEAVAYMAAQPARPAQHRLRAQARQAKTYTPVLPICTTQWDQGAPYNNLCPMDSKGRSVTGCVATAAAQVMKAHNHPARGTGSHSYQWKDIDNNVTTLSADFKK